MSSAGDRGTAFERFLDQVVHGWMRGDIVQGLAMAREETRVTWKGEKRYFGGQNFLVALGLTCYTEFLGSLVSGTFGGEGHSASNFDAFLFGCMDGEKKYEAVEARVCEFPQVNPKKKASAIYQLVRCGLTHQYFGKGPVQFFSAHAPNENCGIKVEMVDGKKVVQFLAEKYLEDLLRGVEMLRRQLIDPAHRTTLLSSFERAKTMLDSYWE